MKNLKRLRLMFWRDPNAIVAHCVDGPVRFDSPSHRDFSRPCRVQILDGVVEKVGENLANLDGITPARRELLNDYFCCSLAKLEIHRLHQRTN